MNREYIKEFSGKILGYVETSPNGDQTAFDFDTRQILGYYRASHNHTTDFLGRVVAKGNCVASFIYNKRK